MKKTSAILSLVIIVAATLSVAGCINVQGPEKIEVKGGDSQSSSQKVPYGGSKQDWKKFGKGFANAE